MVSFARVRDVFERSLGLDAAERGAFLDRECAGDAALRRDVDELLRADGDASTVGAVLDRPAAALVAPPVAAEPGTRIGGFLVEAVLGSGGMGTVYRAAQDEPKRVVALKVLSLGLLGDGAVRRFRWEAEVLARLRHPGIAQVYAVGVHRAGALELPWFAMELVDCAQSLTAYAVSRALGVRERLTLLLQLCDAVHHGHLHGVVHRDLKPQNVLVDRDGRVKVIDFGIARSTTDGDDGGVRTERGYVLGTLAYMSPEQVAGAEVDLRTDVWSLGVIAFELLADERPFATAGKSALAAARTIDAAAVPPLRRFVRGAGADLDVVLGKALRREREDRYPSVAAFGDDLRAYLDHRPVAARAPSTLHQLRLFARRRRGLVGAIAAIAAVLVASVVVLSLQNVELGRRERLATRVATFARDFLAESDVMRARGIDYTVREALDEAAARLDDELFPDARTEAELRQLVGDTYRGLALPAVAEPQLRRAIERWRQAAGADDPATIRAELALVLTLRELDRNADAQRLLAELEQRRRAGVADEPLALELRHMRAMLLRDDGRLREAEQMYRDVLAARERVLGTDAEATLATMHNLGTLLLSMQRTADARVVLQRCLERSERSGHGRTATWQVADNLAEAWRELGDLERAATTHRQAIAGYTALVGPDHALTLGCGYHLLKVLRQQEDFAALRDLAAELVPRCERTFGREHRRTMHVLAAHAVGLMNCGDAAGACRLFERAYAVQLRDLGPEHPDAFVSGNNLVGGRLAAADHDGALALATELVGGLDAAGELPAGLAASTWLGQARAFAAAGRTDDARRASAQAHALAAAALPAEHPLVRAIDELRGRLAPPR